MQTTKKFSQSDNVGLIRRLDTEGRFLVPVQFRRTLGWTPETPLEILSDGEGILIRRSARVCVFCQSEKNLRLFEGKPVCQHYIERLH